MKIKSTMLIAALAITTWAFSALAKDDQCDGLKGKAKAECMKDRVKHENHKGGRSDDMKGLGAQDKGHGAEKGKGLNGDMKDKAKKQAKNKAKDKANETAGE